MARWKGGISNVNLSILAGVFFWAWQFIPWTGRQNVSTPSTPSPTSPPSPPNEVKK